MTTDTIMYSYSFHAEGLYRGHYATPDDAAAAGFRKNPEAETVWVGVNTPAQTSQYVSASIILEEAAMAAYDDVEQAAEDWLHALINSPEKIQELETLVVDWINANDPPDWMRVENCREYHRTDIDAAGLLQGEE